MTAASGIRAGSRILASQVEGVAPLAAYKSTDQSVTSSTVLVNDSALFLSVLASATYKFILDLDYEGATQGTGDIKTAWSLPAGATMRYNRISLDQTGASTVGFMNNEGNTPIMGTNGAGALRGACMSGTITTSTTAGTVQFRWAQNTSNGTATIVHATSRMKLRRIA